MILRWWFLNPTVDTVHNQCEDFAMVPTDYTKSKRKGDISEMAIEFQGA